MTRDWTLTGQREACCLVNAAAVCLQQDVLIRVTITIKAVPAAAFNG